MAKKYDFGKDCILIARVSTQAQVLKPGASPQIKDLRQYAIDLGYNSDTFKEINSVESGFLKEDSKIGWNLVTQFIEENPTYRTIICTEMSRLSRNRTVLFHMLDYFLNHKVQLIIKDISFQLYNDFGEIDPGKDIIFSLYASLAASEMRQKKERFKRALADYREAGYSIGGKKLFGYIRVKDPNFKDKKKYIKDDVQAEQVKNVFEMYAYGIDNDITKTSAATITLECIARGYDKFLHSKRNVQSLLKNSAYTGHKETHNKVKNPEYWNYKNQDADRYVFGTSFICTYPRIIDDGLFAVVQERLKQENTHVDIGTDGQTRDKSSQHITILAKILRCRYCGSYFVGDYRVDTQGFPRYSYRDCGTRAHKGLRKCTHGQTISMRMLDSAVWSFVKNMVVDITAKQQRAKTIVNKEKVQEEIERLKERYDEIDRRIKAANKIFTQSASMRSDFDEAEREYQASLKRIESDKKLVDKEIEAKYRQLSLLNNTANNNLDEVIAANIDVIEKNKEAISRYVHLLIKEIVPLDNQIHHVVLQVAGVNNMDEVLNYGEEDTHGLPKIVNDKHEGVYYLVIQKDFHGNYAARVITNQSCLWNDDEKLFTVSDEKYTAEDIFNIDVDIEEMNDPRVNTLTRGIKILDMTTLDVYDDDITEGMKVKMEEKRPTNFSFDEEVKKDELEKMAEEALD